MQSSTNDSNNNDNDNSKRDQHYEGIAAGDIPAILEAIDVVMKYTRRKGDTMAIADLERHVDALLKFSTFAFISLSKLIDYHTKTVAPEPTTTNTDDIKEIMKRYGSFYG